MALPPEQALRRWTYHCLFGLLAVTGLRIGESLALRRDDVDIEEGILTIRGAKFGKSRLVTIHPSTRQVLLDYAPRRDVHLATPHSSYFLVAERCG
ncbi:tyrosine-type recombinase/integrase [Marinobacter sp. BSs20148]|uniref:tyrosine-type recombinase/integrase n=1 Tax=Marinobacter sp. BSs20148 TaxID=490759 RepID=UPI0022260F85|nr:tyrosine-type recombinase/integrase [Marinobacter sp. BSs20148]